MTLRHLKILKEVCECRSVTQAAKNLYIAQPSVSAVIKETEEHYGVRLFKRIKNRLVITEAGQELYERACNVLNDFNDFENCAYKKSRADTIKIGTSLTIGTFLLPELMKKIRKNFPSAEMKIKIFPKESVENAVLTGELDLGLVENAVNLREFDAQKFYRDELVAVCAKDYPAPDTLKISELFDYPFILREKGSASRERFDSFSEAHGVKIEPFIESANPQAALNCAAAGLGIAILPLGMAEEKLKEGTLRRVGVENTRFEREYYVISRKKKPLTALQRNVLALCTAFLSE